MTLFHGQKFMQEYVSANDWIPWSKITNVILLKKKKNHDEMKLNCHGEVKMSSGIGGKQNFGCHNDN